MKYGTLKRNPWGRKPKVISEEQAKKLVYTSLVFPKEVGESKSAKALVAAVTPAIKAYSASVDKLIDALLAGAENKEANIEAKAIMHKVAESLDIIGFLIDPINQNRAYLAIKGIKLTDEDAPEADSAVEVDF